MQTQDHTRAKAPEYRSAIHCARSMLAREGVSSFAKGIGPSLLGLTHVAIQFPLYEKLKSTFPKEEQSTPLVVIATSATSKLSASLVTYPLELVRTRLHVQRSDLPLKYGSVIDSFKVIVKNEGVRGLYAGLSTNLIRVVPACSITFAVYEKISAALTAKYDDVPMRSDSTRIPYVEQ